MAEGKQSVYWWEKGRRVVSIPLWYVSLAGLPANLVRWWHGIQFVKDHTSLTQSHPFVWRIISICLAMFLSFYTQIMEKLRPKLSFELTPTSGNNPDMELRVRNRGTGRAFYVQCELLALRNSPNSLPQITFDLQWTGRNEKRLFLEKEDSANLIIASFKQDHKTAFADMNIWGLYGVEKKSYGWAGWSTNSQEKLPEYDLGISVRSDGTKLSEQRIFTLRPKRFYGPLEMVEYTTEAGVV